MIASELAIQAGTDGELALRDWFNTHDLPYVYVNQDRDMFGCLFKKAIKRPDFLMLIPSIGMIAIDTKNHQSTKGGFNISTHEIKRMLNFEQHFRMPLWFVSKEGPGTWFWISGLKVAEVGVRRSNQKGEEFLFIDNKHCYEVKSRDDLAQLYTSSFG